MMKMMIFSSFHFSDFSVLLTHSPSRTKENKEKCWSDLCLSPSLKVSGAASDAQLHDIGRTHDLDCSQLSDGGRSRKLERSRLVSAGFRQHLTRHTCLGGIDSMIAK